MAKITALKLTTEKLEKLVPRLGELTGEALGKVVVRSVNDVAAATYDLARNRMLNGINLTDAYVRRKMDVELATAAKPTATITATGTQTLLSEYRRVQHDRQVNWTNARIAAAGHKFGKWPGWTRRTGSQKLGIAPDRKTAGISAAPVGRTNFGHAFSIPGKRDGSGNLIMFSRSPTTGKIRALLGPAVYQLFSYQVTHIIDDTLDALEDAVSAAVEDAIKEAITP